MSSRPFRLVRAVCFIAFLSPGSASAARPDDSAAKSPVDPATVQRYGPAYRYPRAGWIVIHIEGKPYDRGYQHGRLLAHEIADYIDTLAGKRSAKAPGDAWRANRMAANAIFLRKFDPEYLEEMKGIADGAAAAGAKFDGRAVDFLDVVTVNAEIELDFLDSALDATAHGLESRVFREPPDQVRTPTPPEHCSAFAATGPATADGKIVIGHITMFGQYFVRHFNVWLDIKPEKGHRVLMQTYPGGIQSGMDYYLNDAGLVVAETTIKQTKFDIRGETLASRIRRALQYSETIDQAVEALKKGNNGLYTNEWLLADTKTNEIAMFELGTAKSKLWRSSQDEWVGGTKGFYWGCNNAKDLDVRLETVASVEGRPANMVYRPSDRDRTWIRLYEKHKGKIGPEFGFEAFTTPPLSAFASLDAKFTTSAMAGALKTWALFGPPLGKAWDPSEADRRRFPASRPLISNDWTVLTAEAPIAEPAKALAASRDSRVVLASLESGKDKATKPVDLPTFSDARYGVSDEGELVHPAAWHGTILPKSDADIWLAAAFADYEKAVARELALKARAKAKGRELTRAEKDEIALPLFAAKSRYSTAVARLGKDIPLDKIQFDWKRDEWYGIAAGKGVLFFSALRVELGENTFLKLMDEFGRAHAGKAVSTEEFTKAFNLSKGPPGNPFDPSGNLFKWLLHSEMGLPRTSWSVDSFEADLDRTVIVYGTLKESDAQREAAYRLQRQIERKWSNIAVPVLSDREATHEKMKGHHLLLVGRPDTNEVAKRLDLKRFPGGLTFGSGSFVLRGETFANPKTALIIAAPHPDPDETRSSTVLFAGLSAEATWHCVEAIADRAGEPANAIVLPAGGKAHRLAVGSVAFHPFGEAVPR